MKVNISQEAKELLESISSQQRRAYIFDMDGTLTNCDHRVHFISGDNKDWDGFNAAMGEDTPNGDVVAMAKMVFDSGAVIIIVTGRFGAYDYVTTKWLIDNKVPYHVLMSREDGDYRSDFIIKRQIYQRFIQPFFDVVGVFEDRNGVVAMWRELGLTCFQVKEGGY